MPGRANDLIVIPDSFWRRAEVTAALRSRRIGQFFDLVHQHTGASQTQIGMACGFTQGKVSFIVRGISQVEKLEVFERIADGLKMPDSARIIMGLAPRTPPTPRKPAPPIPRRDSNPAPAARVSGPFDADPEGEQEDDDPVRRRTFVGLTGASLLGAVFTDPADSTGAVSSAPLAAVLTGHAADTPPEPLTALPDITALTHAVTNAKRQYQACRYAELIKHLPALLTKLRTACLTLGGENLLRACTLSADAHHVAASLLLKLDDQGLAYLAADRSMRAAHASDDPATVGTSARIVMHTLMNGGHLTAAVNTASTQAARLDREVGTHTPESLSVYGALLLGGAVAAAQDNNRSTAHELLAEADDAGQRLGLDGNLRWTAFGPTNAKLHRINIAVTLGDAGTAVDVARGIDLSSISVTERRATLLIDTARAFLQWGKHEKAYLALRAAEQTAPEEISDRPSAHRLVRELVTTAPPTVRRDAEQFARQLGVSR
jgi:hypothetical protein